MPTAATLDRLIDLALAEDVGGGDLTTEAIVPAGARGTATVEFRERGVVCGVPAALAVFHRLDPGMRLDQLVAESGTVAQPPQAVARFTGSHRALLTGERTALNLLQRVSGIATLTRRYVEAVTGTGVQLLDTRKTAPGMRELDRYAVACGGGGNHRSGLHDAILIKDNHRAVAGGVAAAVRAVRSAHPELPVEVEVDTLEQLDQALESAVDTILLDNMPLPVLEQAVRRTGGRARLEASGGITLDTVRAIAETGVDAISIGALTHSVRALDVSLEVTPSQP